MSTRQESLRAHKTADFYISPTHSKVTAILPSLAAIAIGVIVVPVVASLANNSGNIMDGLWLFLVIVVNILLHEFIHIATAVVIGGVKFEDISIINNLPQSIAILVNKEMRIEHYRILLVAPLLIIGPVMLAICLIHPSVWFALATSICIGGCAIDVEQIWSLRSVRAKAWIRDCERKGYSIWYH